MKQIAEKASGFLYLISKTGVTGSAGFEVGPIRDHVADLRAITDLPICVGFGIAHPAEARALAPHVDGVVIGSAFARTIADNLDTRDLIQRLEKQVREYKAAMKISPPQD